MSAYYNEFDPYAAQWLRNLIEAGHIAPGIVDERSIEDVHPSDLRGFTQCHFFAGIGVWSLALRRAGWADDRPVWTGSCPCQPFSAAGKGAGFVDERHLWPAWHHLIKEHGPTVIFGEQVASKAVEPWVDLVHADMEAMDYAFGATPFPSAGVGAPHIRDRLFWVADSNNIGQSRGGQPGSASGGRSGSRPSPDGYCISDKLGNPFGSRLEERVSNSGATGAGAGQAFERASVHPGGLGNSDSDHSGRNGRDGARAKAASSGSGPFNGYLRDRNGLASATGEPGPVNGFWRAADWLGCRDDKWRPVEPGTFPLANGAASRVGRLRAYGNAINAEAATQFIAAYLET